MKKILVSILCVEVAVFVALFVSSASKSINQDSVEKDEPVSDVLVAERRIGLNILTQFKQAKLLTFYGLTTDEEEITVREGEPKHVRVTILINRVLRTSMEDNSDLFDLMQTGIATSDGGIPLTYERIYGIEAILNDGTVLELSIMPMASGADFFRNGRYERQISMTCQSRDTDTQIYKAIGSKLRNALPCVPPGPRFPQGRRALGKNDAV